MIYLTLLPFHHFYRGSKIIKCDTKVDLVGASRLDSALSIIVGSPRVGDISRAPRVGRIAPPNFKPPHAFLRNLTEPS